MTEAAIIAIAAMTLLKLTTNPAASALAFAFSFASEATIEASSPAATAIAAATAATIMRETAIVTIGAITSLKLPTRTLAATLAAKLAATLAASKTALWASATRDVFRATLVLHAVPSAVEAHSVSFDQTAPDD